jgi:hypothetical protein
MSATARQIAGGGQACPSRRAAQTREQAADPGVYDAPDLRARLLRTSNSAQMVWLPTARLPTTRRDRRIPGQAGPRRATSSLHWSVNVCVVESHGQHLLEGAASIVGLTETISLRAIDHRWRAARSRWDPRSWLLSRRLPRAPAGQPSRRAEARGTGTAAPDAGARQAHDAHSRRHSASSADCHNASAADARGRRVHQHPGSGPDSDTAPGHRRDAGAPASSDLRIAYGAVGC